jgi:hypothetical protein
MKGETVDPTSGKKKRDGIEKENKARATDGIISYLTKKHWGNVQEKGIVIITGKTASGPNHRRRKNVADISSAARPVGLLGFPGNGRSTDSLHTLGAAIIGC